MSITFSVSSMPKEMWEWVSKCDSRTLVERGKDEMIDVPIQGRQPLRFAGKHEPDIIIFEDDKVALLFQIKYNEYIIDHKITYYFTPTEYE